jgi:hypothetical protein
MITIFNRQEVFTTMDLTRQVDIRNILAANGIKYIVKVTNLQRNRGRTGSFGIKQNYAYIYKIYVHKKDHEKALCLIR